MTDPFRDELIALLPRLRRFALGLSGQRDSADDLVQAACVKALTNRAQWTPGTRLDSWMFRITQNLWIDELRSPRSNTVELDPDDDTAAVDSNWTHATETSVALDQVLAAMQRLPEWMRAILMLVCVEQLTYREAADVLGVPLGTVMSRLSRARLALLQSLGAATGDLV